ncbi:MAG: polyprenyl synthetase family protein [Turicibacter sp.]|nr:polyprenyl synthetase family protein [Turicibacter sp.]
MNIHAMWNDYPQVRSDLLEMLRVIDKNIKIREKQIEQNIKNLTQAGGKLLRPAYFLLASHIGPQHNKEQAIAIAAALEVLHMATLVHDDVIDDAPTRRGLETIQAKFGKNYAVYTGDYLFCVCFKILSRYSDDLAQIDLNTGSMERILLGELDQMGMRYNFNMGVKEYLRQISGKTAQLFALSCYLGAEVSQANNFYKHLAKKVGHNIGMAFQIMDDILDYTKNADLIGKPVLNDMKQGVYSLPLIYAMNQDPQAFLPYLKKKENMTDSDLLAVVNLIHKYKGVEEAQNLASKYTDKAIRLIQTLPEGSYRSQMLRVTLSLLKRET